MVILERLNRWLHARPPSKDEWRTCPVCQNDERKKCYYCNGQGRYYHYDKMHPTWVERLCPHWWVYEGKDSRFCRFCGRHEHRNSEMFERWELIWNVKEAGILKALLWYHRQKRHENRTYDDIAKAYKKSQEHTTCESWPPTIPDEWRKKT